MTFWILVTHSLIAQSALPSIDLNSDVGEVSHEIDHAILPWVSSCNVSCGAHAGDRELIGATVRVAVGLGVAIGAHPSYPDRERFGRCSLVLPIEELLESLRDQIQLVQSLIVEQDAALHHVKPHGALYHDLASNERLATALVDLLLEVAPGASLYGQAGSPLEALCESRGVRFVHEAFGDRRYEDGDSLRDRSQPDALLEEGPAFDQHFRELLGGAVVDAHGQRHRLVIDTICLHSDSPGAVGLARRAHQLLEECDVRLAAH